jgi:energy-coupling factor transporter ATP-binding protein EcfA2
MNDHVRKDEAPSAKTADLRQDRIFFGRADELYELTRNLQRGRHTLLIGEKGIGKTRLMLEAKNILSGRKQRIEFSAGIIARKRGHLALHIVPDQYRILSIDHPSPMGDCLKEMAEQLHHNGDLRVDSPGAPQDWPTLKKRLSGLGSVKVQAVILEAVSRSRPAYLIFIDNLDRISPTQQAFLESLLSISVICTAVVQMKESFVYRRIWASFARIRIDPLPEQICIQLIDYFFQHYALHPIDPALYRREVLKSANGNPFLIKNLLWHGSRQRRLGLEEIRSLRRVEEGAYFNMGPLYIFSAGIFTLFKIFSIGTDNREFYIYFSALGFLVYLIFRVFRTFFLFRPQKYNK